MNDKDMPAGSPRAKPPAGAYIRESRLDDVVRALRVAGARAVTVVKIVPMGAEVQPEFVDISRAVPVRHFAPMVKLELVCEDEQADKYVDIIRGNRDEAALL